MSQWDDWDAFETMIIHNDNLLFVLSLFWKYVFIPCWSWRCCDHAIKQTLDQPYSAVVTLVVEVGSHGRAMVKVLKSKWLVTNDIAPSLNFKVDVTWLKHNIIRHARCPSPISSSSSRLCPPLLKKSCNMICGFWDRWTLNKLCMGIYRIGMILINAILPHRIPRFLKSSRELRF